MKKTSNYESAIALESRVNESSGPYTTLLDDATEQFIQRLEVIEKRCADPATDPESLFHETCQTMLDMGAACEEFEQGVEHDKAVIHDAALKFRGKTDRLISKSHLLNHGRTWPNGHPGDHKIIEAVYQCTEMSGGLGFYLDKYFLFVITLAVAVRGRKERLCELLLAELSRRPGPRILDVACGSCREVFELAPAIQKSGAKVICIDTDTDALDFSANRLSLAGLRGGDQVKFLKYNAIRMINHERNLKEFGLQDVIYSVGLFDYLDDAVLTRLLAALYTLLAPGGKLIASYKDSRRYSTFDNRWLLDWDAFYQRTEEDMWSLYEKAGIPINSITTIRENSGVILFFTATK